MTGLTRRKFAKLSAAAAITAVGPALAVTRLAGSGRERARALREPARDEGEDDQLQSDFLADLTLEAQAPHEVGAVNNRRLVVPVSGGTVEGPRLRGTVIGPGGDWIVERADGSRVLDVRVLLVTDDAQTIYVSWRGIAYTPPGGKLWARILPVFETGAPKYAWLNNVVAVGVYRGIAGKISYRIYQIL